MDANLWMTFPALEQMGGIRHRFTLRHPQIDVNAEKAVVVERLWDWHREHVRSMGLDAANLKTAEQVHGVDVAVVDAGSAAGTAQVDALISNSPDVVIGIYVADCCAVYLVDPVRGALGVAHAGKKGSEGGIVPAAIAKMTQHFGTEPADLIVQLSPCIRPPAYEIDFAALIRRQALEAGVQPRHLHDTGICTSSDLRRFYSYRMEKGRTGRMLALLGGLRAG